MLPVVEIESCFVVAVLVLIAVVFVVVLVPNPPNAYQYTALLSNTVSTETDTHIRNSSTHLPTCFARPHLNCLDSSFAFLKASAYGVVLNTP